MSATTDPWADKWNARYSNDEYAFGTEPNEFLHARLPDLTPGNILFPAEGEGRNAVYAAKLGWNVSAFDISLTGREKALKLAAEYQVEIDYQVGELPALQYEPEQFDAIALIYAHFPAAIKSQYHKILNTLLRPGGMIIFEAFGKQHLEYVMRDPAVGGPRDLPTLFSQEELQSDFAGYDFIELDEIEITLNEGLYHVGKGSVIRFVARKS